MIAKFLHALSDFSKTYLCIVELNYNLARYLVYFYL